MFRLSLRSSPAQRNALIVEALLGAYWPRGLEIGKVDSEGQIGNYAGWDKEEDVAPPRGAASGGMLGTASAYNSENLWRGTLALLYMPVVFIVLTVWLWLGLPAWMGWLSFAFVALTLVIVGLVGPLRLTSMILMKHADTHKR